MGKKRLKFQWNWIKPLESKIKKLGCIIAFDIETRQIPVNKKISTYRVKEKSELLFGTACLYVHGEEPIKSKLGFFETVKSYALRGELFFKRKEEFTEFILNAVCKYRHIYVYAHNISFDIRESVELETLRKNGFEMTIFNPQSKQFIIKFVKKDNNKHKWSITFTDTLNLYPASLEAVGDTIGLPKLEKELGLDRANLDKAIEEGKWNEVLKYNVRDTQIVANAVIIRERVVNDLGASLKLTNPSTAMDLFRRRFQKRWIKKPSKKYRNFIRSSYFGGRTEVFFRGVISTNEYKANAEKLYLMKKKQLKEYGFTVTDRIIYADINSLYPYSMKYFPTPVSELQYIEGDRALQAIRDLYKLGLVISFDPLNPLESIYKAWKKQLTWLPSEKKGINWDKVKYLLHKYRGTDVLLSLRKYFAEPVLYIAEATVHIEKRHITESIPPLPVKKEGKLIFPQGLLKGIWCQYELDLLHPPKDTSIIQVHRVLLFRADWLFVEYVDTFYNMKSESKKKGDKVMYLVSKLFMNSLYGKWAECKRITVTMSAEQFAKYIIEYFENKSYNASIELAMNIDYGIIRTDGLQINTIGGYYEVKTKDYSEPYSTAISSFITSAARATIRHYMYLIIENGGVVYYSDTDSLITDLRGKEALEPYIDPYKLGYLDEEIKGIAFVEINTLKDYKVFVPRVPEEYEEESFIGYIRKLTFKLDETTRKVEYYYFDSDKSFKVKYKLKGVPLSKAVSLNPEDDSKFVVERLVGVREFLKYGKFGLYWIEQVKEVTRNYDKAQSADGWVVPYWITVSNSQTVL